MGTDGAWLETMTNEEAWQNALDDPDNPPLSEEELAEFMAVSELPGERAIEKCESLRERKRPKPARPRFGMG